MRKMLTLVGVALVVGGIIRGCNSDDPRVVHLLREGQRQNISGEFSLMGWFDDENLLLKFSNYVAKYNVNTAELTTVFELPSDQTFRRETCSEEDNWWFPIAYSDNYLRLRFSGDEVQSEEVYWKEDRVPENSWCRTNSRGISRQGIEVTGSLVPDLGYVRGTELRFAYDLTRHEFLWLHEPRALYREFKKDWTLPGWIINEKTKKVEEVHLPEGPWVNAYYLWDAGNYCTYGIGCPGMHAYIANHEIYVHVYGDSKQGSEGVFRLRRNAQPGEAHWEQLIRANIKRVGLVFNPDGCTVAYLTEQGDLYLANVCTRPKS